MFHQMGTGKTIVSLIIAAFLSKNKKNIIIVLPNNNIREIWISKINLIKQLLPFENYNLDNIDFVTKKEIILTITTIKTKPNELKNRYFNSIFIIDEAHNLFGNTGSESFLFLQSLFYNSEVRPLFILVTGSPLTNTLLTFKDLFSMLSYTKINETIFVEQTGNKIFNYALTKDGEEIIKKELKGCISYYTNKKDIIPKEVYNGEPIIKIPVIPCQMSKIQSDNYYNIKSKVENEMFFKHLLDASFTAMGDFNNIKNFDNNIKSGKKHILTDTLYLNNGRFHGEELMTLKNSCKLKYFVEEKINKTENRCKTFIYFSNAKIGGRFIKDVMNTQGIQEYGNKELNNFVCYYCGRKRKCVKCKPLTYIIITSIYITNIFKKTVVNSDDEIESNKQNNLINNLINIYNSPINDNGEEVCFIFGSKIISESYTLMETKDIWFLTIPDSLSELEQIIARCLRNFSYKDININVYINILIAVQKDFDLNAITKQIKKQDIEIYNDVIEKYINNLIEKDNDYPYDMKKLLYLEIKSQQTNYLLNLFKKLSVDTKEEPYKDIKNLFILEVLRRLITTKTSFYIDELHLLFPQNMISIEELKDLLDMFIKDGVILYNIEYQQVFLIEKNNRYYIKPIKIISTPFLYRIEL